MDIIGSFYDSDPNEENLKELYDKRTTKYFFGEYLSQGALNIEGNCVQKALKI
jgi:hypothetical protein